MAFVTGKQLGRYEIRSKIGEGGMGEVYLALDTELDRTVAIKILPAALASDQQRLQRFIQEAKAASALNHPNILTIHEIGQTDDIRFIATEYIEGETLRQYLLSNGMRLNEVLDVWIQVASALAAAHKTGIVHRDIKPDNIMIRHDRIVKILDFGLAKLAPASVTMDSQATTRFKTEPGILVGTAIYMSPEQARGLDVDTRTDIFSLGVVMYEMVAGCLPFAGSTSSEVMASILSEGEPQPLARYSREVPAELERIVSKALRKNRDERYQTISDLLLDLKNLKEELQFERKLDRSLPSKSKTGGPTETPAEVLTLTESRHRAVKEPRASSAQPRKRTIVVAIAAALLLISSVVVAYLFLMRQRTGALNSIAVLPFVNASNNPDAEFLSEGISESLINSLSQLPGLKVIARSSSFKYNSKDADPQLVANALGVEAILTGRVTQRGDNLVISVELVDARDKTQVWGEQYNRKATDLLSIQSDIARDIASTLRLKLTSADQQQFAKRETTNPQAYELLLKGRYVGAKGRTEDAKKAIEYFQQAIALDPKYALAYAELSIWYEGLVGDSTLDPKEALPKAEAAARQALDLDGSLAEAHLALANLKRSAWDWPGAEREFQRAIALNPNLAGARHGYAVYLSIKGRHEQAGAEMKHARELDPLSLIVNLGIGVRLYFARQYDNAIEAFKKTLEMDQDFAPAHIFLGYAYAAKGMYPEAIAAYQQFIKLSGDDSSIQISLGAAYAKSGQREKAHTILQRLETTTEYVSPAELAVLCGALGEHEHAGAALAPAATAHDLQLQYLSVDPAFDPLRSAPRFAPRFAELVRRLGLP